MNYENFIASRVEMTVTQYLQTYLSLNDKDHFSKDTIKVHVYADGMHVDELPNKKFYVMWERSDMVDTLHSCERALWDNFAKYELNGLYINRPSIDNIISELKKETGLEWEDSTYGNDTTGSVYCDELDIKIMIPNADFSEEEEEYYDTFTISSIKDELPEALEPHEFIRHSKLSTVIRIIENYRNLKS